MRLYLSRAKRDELEGLMVELGNALSDENLSAKERAKLEEHRAALAGLMLSPLFPTGIVRNVLMTGFVILGFLAFLTPHEWLFWSFFIAATFSPWIMGKLAHKLGRARRSISASRC